MAFDGNGTFQRLMNWVQDAATGIKIKADRHDQQDDDFAAGLTNVITKDGQTQPTNDIPMNGKRIVNLGAPTAATDASTKAYVDAIKTFTTGMEISGADVNGQLKFSSTTGVNGLVFTGADLSWLARLASAAGPGTPPVPPATLNRMVLNDKPDGSGADVIIANEDGTLVAKNLTVAGSAAQVSVKSTAGNGHVWFYAADGTTTRMILYTSSGAQGSGFLQVAAQNFEFNTSGQIKAPGALFAAAAIYNTDGNVSGTAWDPWGAHDAVTAISARIEARAQAWANDRIQSLQYRKVSRGSTGGTTDGDCPAGAVITGYKRDAGQTGQVWNLYFKYLQIYDPVRGWVGFSEA